MATRSSAASTEGPEALLGRRVFCLHPHQDRLIVPAEAVLVVPEDVPDRRAVLAANMETAINGLWDGAPGPGDRIAVIGAGVVGALIGALAARLPGAVVELIDIDPGRETLAAALGCRFARPEQAAGEADLVFHASGSAEGLRTALGLAGVEAVIVEMSWYGAQMVVAAARRRLPCPPADPALVTGGRAARRATAALVASPPAGASARIAARPGL